MIDLAWVERNTAEIAATTGFHAVLALVPVAIGLLAALPVGWLVRRSGPTRNLWLALFGLLYAIPSVALFVAMPLLLGTRILDPINVIAALAVYAFALLVRSVSDGFGAVDEGVRQSAIAMGMGPVRRFTTVDLPLAAPVIIAGLRVVTVSTISLVSVGAVIGIGGLGQYFDQGFREGFLTPIVVGLVATVALALICDGLLVFARRVLLPWHGLRGAR